MIGQIGHVICNPWIAWAIMSWRPFSLTAYRMAAELRQRGVTFSMLIDVGANEGQFSRAVREFHGAGISIVGFEPLKQVFERLSRNFNLDRKATFFRLGIGAKNGRLEINVNSQSQSSSFLPLAKSHLSAFPRAREIGKETVDIRTLDDALRDVEWQSPSLLKIDVQGYEAEVLEGAPETLGRVDYVLVEVGLVPLYEGEPTFDQIRLQLERAGLTFVASIATLRDDKRGTEIQMDALFKRSS